MKKLIAAILAFSVTTQPFAASGFASAADGSEAVRAKLDSPEVAALLASANEAEFLGRVESLQRENVRKARPQLVRLWRSGKDARVSDALKQLPLPVQRDLDATVAAIGLNPDRLSPIEKLLNVYSEPGVKAVVSKTRGEIAEAGGFQKYIRGLRAKIAESKVAAASSQGSKLASLFGNAAYARDNFTCAIFAGAPFVSIGTFLFALILLPIYLPVTILACV